MALVLPHAPPESDLSYGRLLSSIWDLWREFAVLRLAAITQAMIFAAFTVFWTVLALLAMLAATRRGLRVLWLAGGGLLAVTVVKMFLVDLSFLAGVTRIVAFIGVGVLLLLIGYVSPMPPKAKEASM